MSAVTAAATTYNVYGDDVDGHLGHPPRPVWPAFLFLIPTLHACVNAHGVEFEHLWGESSTEHSFLAV